MHHTTSLHGLMALKTGSAQDRVSDYPGKSPSILKGNTIKRSIKSIFFMAYFPWSTEDKELL
ncbi:MAG: hypothetical protein QM299_08090 [Pseudomonadota bacterium]|nr:hypothetical protein [Pseudomonadota bacterium]